LPRQRSLEISAVATRSAAGRIECFDVTENGRRDHILKTSCAPAALPSDVAAAALEIAGKIARCATAARWGAWRGCSGNLNADGELRPRAVDFPHPFCYRAAHSAAAHPRRAIPVCRSVETDDHDQEDSACRFSSATTMSTRL
jgi:ATP-grasp domain